MCDRKLELQSYLDDELDSVQRANFDAHLAACAECASELSKLRRLSSLLRSYAPQFPAGAMSRVYEALEDASSRILIRLVTRLTAAAAVILVAGSFWLVSQTSAKNVSEADASAETQPIVLPSAWEHAAVALNADPSPDVQFASLVLADTSNARGQ